MVHSSPIFFLNKLPGTTPTAAKKWHGRNAKSSPPSGASNCRHRPENVTAGDDSI